MPLFPEPTIERVHLGDGDWVDMRRKILHGDRKHANNRAMGRFYAATSAGDNGTAEQEGSVLYSPGDYTTHLLHRMIVAWSDDRPITAENIDALDEATTSRLLAELNAWQETQAPEKRAPLSLASTPSSGTVSEAMPDNGQPSSVIS